MSAKFSEHKHSHTRPLDLPPCGTDGTISPLRTAHRRHTSASHRRARRQAAAAFSPPQGCHWVLRLLARSSADVDAV